MASTESRPPDGAASSRALRRETNEHILALHRRFAIGADDIQVLCECNRIDCRGRVTISLPLYETILGRRGHYLLGAAHEGPRTEPVVERAEDFVVVCAG
jgi:hypothetical protein